MSYSGSITTPSFYMVASDAVQNLSAGLFEKAYTDQVVFHNEFTIPCIGGNTAVIFSIALQADADTVLPTASVSIVNANTGSVRTGSQISVNPYSSQRLYQAMNPIIPTTSNIELSVNILDSGDQVYIGSSVFLMMPIKE